VPGVRGGLGGGGGSPQQRGVLRCRDHERLPQVSESLITWAAITLMTRRLTRRTNRPAERRGASPYYLAQAA
jgi:hypothetical protein